MTVSIVKFKALCYGIYIYLTRKPLGVVSWWWSIFDLKALRESIYFWPQSYRQNLPANRNGEIEDSQGFGSHVPDKEISNDCWSNGGVARFSNPDQSTHDEENPEMLQEENKH